MSTEYCAKHCFQNECTLVVLLRDIFFEKKKLAAINYQEPMVHYPIRDLIHFMSIIRNLMFPVLNQVVNLYKSLE